MCRFFIFFTSVILVLPATTTADELSHKEKLQAAINAKAKNGKNVAAQTAIPAKVQRRIPATAVPESKIQQSDGYISPVPKKNEILIGNELSDD
jgi:hypothetical protein